jgi:IS30 family transposase
VKPVRRRVLRAHPLSANLFWPLRSLPLPAANENGSDNDTAFAQHALMRTMRAMTTWFCDAYASWQKGGVENANGRLRRWLPRQIDIDEVSDEEIQDIVITANLTPRKCLGVKTRF